MSSLMLCLSNTRSMFSKLHKFEQRSRNPQYSEVYLPSLQWFPSESVSLHRFANFKFGLGGSLSQKTRTKIRLNQQESPGFRVFFEWIHFCFRKSCHLPDFDSMIRSSSPTKNLHTLFTALRYSDSCRS